jgi:DNA-binding HxlR family transcriptional regulator
MSGYGQFCPVAKATEVFAERWTPLIIRELLMGRAHFNDLHRGVPLMSRTLLSQRLKKLEAVGVVERKCGQGGPEYELTEAGREFAPIVRLLGEWGQHWYRTNYGRDELDVRVLMWDLRRTVKPEVFPPGRVCVQFEFRQQPKSRQRWWLVCESAEIDLCPTDPGFEVNLFVTTDVKTLAQVVLGDLSLKSALSTGKIELDGPKPYCQHFADWLSLSQFAGIMSCKRAA